MLKQKLLVLFFFLFLISGQFSYARLHTNKHQENDDDHIYRLLKRFFSSQSGIGSTQKPSNVLNSLVYPGSTAKAQVSSQRSTNSPSSSACLSHACEHGGICIPRGQYVYDCKCIGPWRGIYCGIPDACYRLPCQNGGTCLNMHDDYWCKCIDPYYGINCQLKYSSSVYSEDRCRPYICNTGRCISLQTTYYCQCPDDRYGEHCEKQFYKRTIDSYQSYRSLSKKNTRNN
ncbi:unnamed protein product [Adineta ricciae]|uniref:EGF-like domain-containing protein n=1 Tax=Adineta ricciae TaxID=249248 RepID=A0A813N4N3_ADIRI|nr:unnamed protein product [Adineta ricciae]